MEPQVVQITEAVKILKVKRACIDNSDFEDVSATGLKIRDANLSGLEINGAQMGGAYIHSIGMPPPGHPAYKPNTAHNPLKFEDCNLQNSTITNCKLSGVIIEDCNLSGLTIEDCNIQGMKIFGILVEDLLREYKNNNK